MGIVGFPNTVDVTGAASQKLEEIGTLRGRLGWTPSAPWLLYVTGGLAYGHTETNAAFSAHVSPPCGNNGCIDGSSAFSRDVWRAGWTVGGGVEWMFAPRWSFKAEYLYYDLGHINSDSSIAVLAVNSPTVPFIGASIANQFSVKGSIARAGINYHFGAY